MVKCDNLKLLGQLIFLHETQKGSVSLSSSIEESSGAFIYMEQERQGQQGWPGIETGETR